MSLWKLRVGAEAYYLSQVASGLDEYYTGSGEAPGEWCGHSAPQLGLVGLVDANDLRAILAGLAPRMCVTPNGEQLTTHPRRVPGFDLTFAVPKSVSIVYALGDPLIREAIIDGCEAAVGEALAWLEREACFVRRGSNNRRLNVTREHEPGRFGTRRMVTDGFVAARFMHRTPRTCSAFDSRRNRSASAFRANVCEWSFPSGSANRAGYFPRCFSMYATAPPLIGEARARRG